MTQIFIGIGSNIDPSHHLPRALPLLRAQFAEVKLSPVFESEAVGFEGPNFLNAVIAALTDLALPSVVQRLKQIELALGRGSNEPSFGNHCIDLDLLLFDDCCCTRPVPLPRPEILTNAFVLWPLSILAPDHIHPQTGQAFATLWRQYDRGAQRLWPVTLDAWF